MGSPVGGERVYGCPPIALGMLLASLATVTLLGNLLLTAL